MKKIIIFGFIIILAISFNGCGGGGGIIGSAIDNKTANDSADTTSQSANTTYTDVTVEKGPVLDAVVKDSSGKTAFQVGNTNVYRFMGVPTYPITATGGYIDINQDGAITINEDFILDINLSSNNNNITTISTYLASFNDDDVRSAKLTWLKEEFSTSEDKLLATPYTSGENAIKAFTALYYAIKENNTTNESIESYKNLNVTTNGETDILAIAKLYEGKIAQDYNHTISTTITTGPDINITDNNITIINGMVKDINVTVLDSNQTISVINSFDNNISIGTISGNIVHIQALSIGQTQIVVTAINENNDISTKIIYVNVIAPATVDGNAVPVLNFDKNNTSINIGSELNVTITATDSDGNISLLNVLPNNANNYANISVVKTGLNTNNAKATVSIIATALGSFDLVATTLDDENATTNYQVTINVENNATENNTTQTNSTYDAQACLATNGYSMITDNSFDPEGNYDNNNGIAIKALYQMAFNPSETSVSLFYKPSANVDDQNTNWNTYYDDHFETYYISYTDKWFSYGDNIVYVQTPNNNCYKLILNDDSIEQTELEKVTNINPN